MRLSYLGICLCSWLMLLIALLIPSLIMGRPPTFSEFAWIVFFAAVLALFVTLVSIVVIEFYRFIMKGRQ